MLASRRVLGPAALAVLAVLSHGARARAGGFELPDNGTQGLGRGAAFVARADDPSAIYWNPAGLAKQRGTKLLVNANIILHSFEFRRSGTFPDDPNDPATPWGGLPYPAVTNTGGPFMAPFIAASSDLGTFDRLTIGAGVFGPPAVGNRTFPLGVRAAPAASRYDFVQSRSTIIFPTASAAYRVTPWLELGVSGHLVLGNFDQTTVSYTDLGQCKNPEYQPCDSRSTLKATSTSMAATIGAMARLAPKVQVGASVRTPANLDAEGTVTPQPPASLPVEVAPGKATLSTKLPMMARAGVRYVELDGDFELYDLELNVTYERWSAAQGTGPVVSIPELGALKDIQSTVVHKYKDTFGVRAGGAYNIEALDGVLSLRGGAYFDSAATEFAYTRLDFDTLAKIAGTLGVGYRSGPWQVDFAYGAVASIPRVVGTGEGNIRPLNGAKNGQSLDGADQVLPAVNEGAYRGFTNIFSVGVTVTFDHFFGKPRAVRYGNPWEPGYVAEGEVADKASERAKEKEPEPAPDKREDKPAVEEKKPDAPPPKKEERKEEKKADPPKKEDKPPEEKPTPPPKKEEKPPEKKKEWWEQLDE